jgi:two-component system NarL family sensor kinase
LTAAEDERQRIRRDLHDGLGPALTAISLQLSAALDHAAPGAGIVTSLKHAARAATTAKAEVRRIIDGMAPAQLDRLGLMAALRALGDQLNADPAAGTPGHPIVSVDGPATLDTVAPEVEVGAYRIAAEAMLNAHRHSGGCNCRVTASVSAGELHLCVDDDGVGLAPGGHRGDAVGLASMRARVDALGGRVEVGPGRDGGTTLAVTIPAQGRGEDDDR